MCETDEESPHPEASSSHGVPVVNPVNPGCNFDDDDASMVSEHDLDEEAFGGGFEFPEDLPPEFESVVPALAPSSSSSSTVTVLPGNEARPKFRLRSKHRVVVPRLRTKTFSPLCLSQARAALQFGASQRQLHPSHSLAGARGLLWCWRCGCVATVCPRKLTEPCKTPTRHGQLCLNRIRRGVPPYVFRGEWPIPQEGFYRLET